MTSFLKWAGGTAMALAATGQLKSATIKMARMAVDAQKDQISYGKFTRTLTRCSLGTPEYGSMDCAGIHAKTSGHTLRATNPTKKQK